MNNKVKYLSLVFFGIFALSQQINGNNMITNNTNAYHSIATAANQYLNYIYQPGASFNACSDNGTDLCSMLSALVQKTRLFRNPEREDLRDLSVNALRAFRDFDLSGSRRDKAAFVNSLISLLKAVSPLLPEKESAECHKLIKNIYATIQ